MANHTRYADHEVLTYRPKDDNDPREPIAVYAGTGAHDAMRTDPDWELVKGNPAAPEAEPKPKPAAGPKTGMQPDPTLTRGDAETTGALEKLSREELDQRAADVGVQAADQLANKGEVIKAIQEAEKAMHGPAAPATS